MMQNDYIIWTIAMLVDVKDYLVRAFSFVNHVWTFVLSMFVYLMFPDLAYVEVASCIGILCLLDIATKYYALSKQHGGFIKAFKNKYINSDTLWKGTYKKLVTYLLIMILAGISMRISMAMHVSNILATIAYVVLSVRELGSILENIRDSGNKWVNPLLFWIKKQEKQIVEKMIDISENKEEE